LANYYDINLASGKKAEALAWTYRTTFPESLDIKGFIAFYDEKVDVYIDGKLVEKPKALVSYCSHCCS
jgi:uncharacterized protein (DUF427 family)